MLILGTQTMTNPSQQGLLLIRGGLTKNLIRTSHLSWTVHFPCLGIEESRLELYWKNLTQFWVAFKIVLEQFGNYFRHFHHSRSIRTNGKLSNEISFSGGAIFRSFHVVFILVQPAFLTSCIQERGSNSRLWEGPDIFYFRPYSWKATTYHQTILRKLVCHFIGVASISPILLM